MTNLLVVVDFLSRAFALILAAGALLGFVFRKFVGAWIDALFKRKVNSELETLKHQLATSLEERKAELNRHVTSEVETLKGRIAREMEQERRALDEEMRRSAGHYDKNSAYFEVFYVGYSRVISELWALQHDYTAPLELIEPGLGGKMRESFRMNVLNMLSQTNASLEPHSAYVDVSVQARIAKLYASLVDFITNGASGEESLSALSREMGMISAEFRNQLTERRQ